MIKISSYTHSWILFYEECICRAVCILDLMEMVAANSAINRKIPPATGVYITPERSTIIEPTNEPKAIPKCNAELLILC